MKYIFRYDSGVIDIRSDILPGHENDPHITVEDDFKLLKGYSLDLDFENNKVIQMEIPTSHAEEKTESIDELLLNAIDNT